jgi:hypothetical protein
MSMRLVPILVLCSIVPTLAAAAAGPPAEPAEAWEVRITPYGWLSAINGTMEIGAESTDLAMGIDDVLSHFGGGGMINGGLRWRRLLVLTDFVFARLTDEVEADSVQVGPPALPIEVGPRKTDVTFWEVTGAFNLGYRLLDRPFPGVAAREGSDPRRLFLDAYAGVRFWWFDQEIEVSIPATTIGGTPVPGGGRSRSVSNDSWWADPQIGLVVGARPWERFSFLLGGSLGGFGIGSASSLAWSAALEGSWHLGEHWSLVVGYKGLGFDRDFRSRSVDGNLDIAMHGPLLGASYRF